MADQEGMSFKTEQVVPTIKIGKFPYVPAEQINIDMKEMKIVSGSTGDEGKPTAPGQNTKGVKAGQKGGRSSKRKTEGEGEVSKKVHI